jgi:S1-C subfamily serine protease
MEFKMKNCAIRRTAFFAFWSAVFLLCIAPNSAVQARSPNASSDDPAALEDELTPDERNNIDIFRRTNQSVVYVTNTQIQRDFFTLNIYEMPAGTGTGFVWDKSGLIVTNYHVIQNANRIQIALWDQSSWSAEVVGVAPHKDLAVLRIEAPTDLLFPITIGDSNQLDVGRKVLAIGNPFGLDTTLTVGVVSALGREIQTGGRRIKDLIQTDAAINPGNSGGPLLNSKGELVGVNTLIYSTSGTSAGVGFAIPVNEVKKIIPQLIRYGKIMRPRLGIFTVPDAIAQRYRIEGIVIHEVQPGSPADKAGMIGLRKDARGNIVWGDIIVKIADQSILNQDDLFDILERFQPGDTVEVETIRGRSRRQFDITLAPPEP